MGKPAARSQLLINFYSFAECFFESRDTEVVKAKRVNCMNPI